MNVTQQDCLLHSGCIVLGKEFSGIFNYRGNVNEDNLIPLEQRSKKGHD